MTRKESNRVCVFDNEATETREEGAEVLIDPISLEIHQRAEQLARVLLNTPYKPLKDQKLTPSKS